VAAGDGGPVVPGGIGGGGGVPTHMGAWDVEEAAAYRRLRRRRLGGAGGGGDMVLVREVGRDGLCLCFFYPSPLKFAPNGPDGPNLVETISAVRLFLPVPSQ
jgi:hypothetical protein